MHGTDRPLAAVQTRHGPNCNYRRYPAFVSPLSQSSSPLGPRTPACHNAQTALHQTHIHPGRRGCMLTHAHRHLPYIQRPHTCCLPHTRSLTHPSCLTHTHHSTHTRGGPHRGASLPPGCSHTRAVSAAHAASSACGAPFTHGVLGSTHSGTLVTTPLTHGVSSILGVSAAPFTTHTGTFTLGTITPGILATFRAPGASIPPKLGVHPFASLVPSTSQGTTEPTWS